ncbi:MAG: YbhN family protein [Actinomycetota bacterium]
MSTPPPASSGKSRWRILRRVGFTLALFLIVEYLVLPQIAGARKSLSLLSDAQLAPIVAGVILEVASILAYAMLTRSLLPHGQRPSLWRLLRIQLSTLAVSHVVPGGSAAGAGLSFRLLEKEGVDGPAAGFALALQSIGSAVVLNVLLWIGLVVSIPLRGFNPLYGTAAIVGIVLIGGFFGLVLLLTRGEARSAKVLRAVARHVPFVQEESVHRAVHRGADQLRTLTSDRMLLLTAVGWAGANWLLDAGSLWLFLAAFGERVPADALFVAYGLANVLAAIPITPGGLGVVEAVMTSTLVGFGTPRGVAVLGVIGYRLVNFWLPIPVGALSYVSIKARSAARKEKAQELERVYRDARESAEDLPTWAERHGIEMHKRERRRQADDQRSP